MHALLYINNSHADLSVHYISGIHSKIPSRMYVNIIHDAVSTDILARSLDKAKYLSLVLDR